MRPLALLACLLTAAGCRTVAPAGAGHEALVLPTDVVANRFFVRPVTAAGDTLRLFTDTGGGLLLLAPAVQRLGLAVDTVRVDGRPMAVTTLPPFAPGASIPPLLADADARGPESRGRVYVLPAGPRADGLGDGMLGQQWFGGRVWTFDYPGRRLLLHASAADVPFDPAHTVPLGFKTDSAGRRLTHFPSLEATIAGETLAFLFDTGATVTLTDSARAVLGGPREQGASFIAASVFERWRTAHPDWRMVDGADAGVGGEPMIEVPEVTVAGDTFGPVWFVRRPDPNFHAYMSAMMDRRVDGALGGSLFQYTVVTVDYPGARALVRRAESRTLRPLDPPHRP